LTHGTPSGARRIGWTDGKLSLRIDVSADGTAGLTLGAAGPANAPGAASHPPDESGPPDSPGVPLADIVVAGEGRSWSGGRYAESVVGRRLRYRDHEEQVRGAWRRLQVRLDDPVTGLRATVVYELLSGHGVLRSWVTLTNHGAGPLTVESVTSFLAGGLTGTQDQASLADLDILWAENDWIAENRWQQRSLRDALPDLNRAAHGAGSRGRFGLTSLGSWSTGTYLPMGAVVSRRTGATWAWQIEHNGAWHWQVGEWRPPGSAGSADQAYLALLGPACAEHHWRAELAAGESFTTVPVMIAVSTDGLESAVAALTAGRRAARRPHDDHRRLPVIFNDYMNTLSGDPTTGRLRPLIAAAARAGAEYFCIDAGWYAEVGEGWWDTVGAWKPSATRFPGGITEVLDDIRARGMVPGLWLEPEVVGVRSPVADQLPGGAFFTRAGQRVVEHGRYHLDLRHPAAIRHLDDVTDYLVGELGVGYLKLDYNINAGPGTEAGGLSAGAGLLGHNRALLSWLDALLDRYPSLTIENCGSGAMRMDYAMLSRTQLQSTSDQQDHLRYAAIAAAAPMAVTPEQAAVWAYPQPSFTDDEIGFVMCNALLGRVHLSGHLDQMSPRQHGLVAEAVSVYQAIRPDLARAVPFWPLGLPRWTDSRLSLGMRAPGATYVAAWSRPPLTGAPSADPAVLALPVRHLRGVTGAEVLYPAAAGARASWDAASGMLTVVLPRTPSACLIQLRH
jgi:alpha-galactosidase